MSKPSRTMDGANARHQCSVCNKAFVRPEHLKRHKSSHAQSWQLRCATCGKSFYRRDALERHKASHGSTNLLRVGGRACFNCADAKAKCSAGLPCERCSSRKLECAYAAESWRHQPPSSNNMSNSHDVLSDGPVNNLNVATNSSQINESSRPVNTLAAQNSESLIGGTMEGDHIAYDNSLGRQVASSFQPVNSCATSAAFSAVNWLSEDVLWESSTLDIADWPASGLMNDPLLSLLDFQSPEPIHNPSEEITSNEHSTDDPPSSLLESESPTQPRSSPHRKVSKKLYVDADKTRVPRTKRRRIAPGVLRRPPMTLEQPGFNFPETLTLLDEGDTYPGKTLRLEQHVYDLMYAEFRRLCVESLASPFLSQNFTSRDSLEILANKGIDSLTKHLPLLHHATIGSDLGASWSLVAALAGIGSQCIETRQLTQFAIAMHEFVRRSLVDDHDQCNQQSSLRTFQLERIQTKVLNCIGLMHSGENNLVERGKKFHLELAASFESMSLDFDSRNQYFSGESLESQWEVWVTRETERRIQSCIWLLDTMWCFQFQMRPFLRLEDANIRLPSSESVWSAPSPERWNVERQDPITTPSCTLLQLVENLYLKKSIPEGISDFTQVLLINALYRRTWEVEQYFRQSLCHWDPSSHNDKSKPENDLARPIWPPSIPAYAKWRNAACDCLDAMHWKANATIEMSAGIETPVVLHLHLARIVLLAPIKNMLNFTRLVMENAVLQSQNNGRSDRVMMLRWATQDQYKARLAIIHSGALFWHIRRFSTLAFYEPAAIALATLTLWCYSCYSERAVASRPTAPVQTQSSPSQEEMTDSDDSESAIPPLMNIDRPADDELVQLFVRKGNSIRANVTGVGDILDVDAPERILSQGQKLLRLSNNWGVTRIWTETLEHLKSRR